MVLINITLKIFIIFVFMKYDPAVRNLMSCVRLSLVLEQVFVGHANACPTRESNSRQAAHSQFDVVV